MVGLNEFEQAVLQKILAGNHPMLATLREQCGHARLAKRENTGVGFFCEFEVEADAPMVPGNFQVGDVHAELEALKYGVGLVLFIREGRLHMLEGYTYDEPWPEQVRGFSLRYTDPERANELAKLTNIGASPVQQAR
jgi:hypothetical protein